MFRSALKPLRKIRARAAVTVTSGAAALIAVPVLFGGGSAAYADPSADQWYQLRMCESTNNYSINTGNGYYGAYQFNLSTWQSVGGTGYPHEASPAEQDARALILYRQRGWQPWTCATKLGFVDDADAKSGYIGDINPGGGQPAPQPPAPEQPADTGHPAFPGQINYGQYSEALKAWQAQMAARGANIPATGYFGDITHSLALQLQVENGFEQVGWIGPLTWEAAWTGTFSG